MSSGFCFFRSILPFGDTWFPEYTLLPVYVLTSMMLVAIKVFYIKIEGNIFLIIDEKLALKFFKINTLEWGNLEECNKKITLQHGW